MSSWARFRDWYNGRVLREQIFILLATLSVIFLLWKSMFFDHLLANQAGMNGEVSFTQGKIDELTQQFNILKKGNGSVERLKAQVDDIEKELVKIDENIASFTQNLISPTEMTTALQSMLANAPKLKLTKIQSLPEEKLVKAHSLDQTTVASDVQLYKHGMEIEFEGGYFDTYNYLVQLEHSHWQFLWDSIYYKVTKYPIATVKIVVHTLSDNEAWIGA